MKACKKCGANDRYKNRNCRPCHKKSRDKWYRENKEAILAKRDPQKQRENVARYRAKNPERYKANQRKFRYNLSAEQYKDLLEKQNNKCAICPETGKLEIDHDHITGKVRGLLCGRCNRAIGLFRDNPDNTASATIYLKLYLG